MSNQLEQDKILLTSAINQCKQNKDLLQKEYVNSNSKLQQQYNEKLIELQHITSEYHKSEQNLKVVQGDLAVKVSHFNNELATKLSEIEIMRGTINSQQKIVQETNKYKKEVEDKTAELIRLQTAFALQKQNNDENMKLAKEKLNDQRDTKIAEFNETKKRLLEDHRQQLMERQAKIDNLSVQLNEIGKLLSEHKEIEKNLKSQLSASVSRLQTLQDKAAADVISENKVDMEQKAEIDELLGSVERLQSEISKLTVHKQEAMKQKEELEKQRADDQKRNEVSIGALREALEKARQDAAKRITDITSLRDQAIRELAQVKGNDKIEFDNMTKIYQAQLKESQLEYQNAKAQLSKQTVRTKELVKKAEESYMKKIETQTRELEKLRSIETKYMTERDANSKKYSDLEASLKDLRAELQTCSTKNILLQKESEEKLKSLQIRYDLVDKISKENFSKFTIATKNLVEITEKHEQIIQHLNESSDQLKTCSSGLTTCSGNVDKLTDRISVLNEQLQGETTSKVELQMQLDSVKRELQKQITSQKSLENLKEKSVKEALQLNSQVLLLTQQLAIVKQNLQEESKTLATERSYKNELRTQLSNTQKTNTQIQATAMECAAETRRLIRLDIENKKSIGDLTKQTGSLQNQISTNSKESLDKLTVQEKQFKEKLIQANEERKKQLAERDTIRDQHLALDKQKIDKMDSENKAFIINVRAQVDNLLKQLSDLAKEVQDFTVHNSQKYKQQIEVDSKLAQQNAQATEEKLKQFENRRVKLTNDIEALNATLINEQRLTTVDSK